MNNKEFGRYLERDGGHCYHCGTTEGLIPQHRINRGSGGPDIPSNIITFCSLMNGEIEADARLADIARALGWKLRPWMKTDLLTIPVYDRFDQCWVYLDNDYKRAVIPNG